MHVDIRCILHNWPRALRKHCFYTAGDCHRCAAKAIAFCCLHAVVKVAVCNTNSRNPGETAFRLREILDRAFVHSLISLNFCYRMLLFVSELMLFLIILLFVAWG